jgi:uncharacterized membrane protein
MGSGKFMVMETSEMINKVKETVKESVRNPHENMNIGKKERIVSLAAGLILGYIGTRSFRKGGFSLLFPAGYLLYRGATGYCHVSALIGRNTAENDNEPFELNRIINISRSRSEVYGYWRNLENLPSIMSHIHKVEKISDNLYHWEAEFNNQKFEWNAEILQDIPNQRIAWQSMEPADVHNRGMVEFIDLPNGQGTALRVSISYQPAQTELGKMIAGFLDPIFKRVVKNDLKEFKRKVERGEIELSRPFVRVG